MTSLRLAPTAPRHALPRGWVGLRTSPRARVGRHRHGHAAPPDDRARAELTYGADTRIAPGLAGSADDLRALTTDVDGLGTLGTRALAAITGGDIPTMQKTIADGKAVIKTIESKTAALRARLAALPGVGAGAEGRLGGLRCCNTSPDRGARRDRWARRQVGHAHRRRARGDPARDVAAGP